MSAYLSNLLFCMPHLVNYNYCVQRFTRVQYHTVRDKVPEHARAGNTYKTLT